MSYYKINTLERLEEVKNTNFHPHGYIVREFDIGNYAELVKPLIEGYLDRFAFGFKYKSKDMTIIKEKGSILFVMVRIINLNSPNAHHL